jgi:hypothetical protein
MSITETVRQVFEIFVTDVYDDEIDDGFFLPVVRRDETLFDSSCTRGRWSRMNRSSGHKDYGRSLSTTWNRGTSCPGDREMERV